MDGDGGFDLGDALVGQPGVLLLEQHLELARELGVVQLTRAVTPQLAVQAPGYITSYEELDPAPAAMSALLSGTNILAVHCHQTKGGQYIDAGIVAAPPKINPAAIISPQILH